MLRRSAGWRKPKQNQAIMLRNSGAKGRAWDLPAERLAGRRSRRMIKIPPPKIVGITENLDTDMQEHAGSTTKLPQSHFLLNHRDNNDKIVQLQCCQELGELEGSQASVARCSNF